jgi:hypothetical protein
MQGGSGFGNTPILYYISTGNIINITNLLIGNILGGSSITFMLQNITNPNIING